MNYKSDIKLGEKYYDEQTGYAGTATAIYFFQHACERVSLETYDANTKKVVETTFDAPRLKHSRTRIAAKSNRPGGPARANEGERPGL